MQKYAYRSSLLYKHIVIAIKKEIVLGWLKKKIWADLIPNKYLMADGSNNRLVLRT
jgi:hypothetical protein